ncbi:hypothetical protein Tcan_06072 [Toxocara canis]|uniref:Uncharacterized protein n=1 Tax=Toxocara canis TaxID=6265 RepID=A0A0B2VG22_TOXCA|nr:hypothetical protein Tcan_06072 [Toxocara canis]
MHLISEALLRQCELTVNVRRSLKADPQRGCEESAILAAVLGGVRSAAACGLIC